MRALVGGGEIVFLGPEEGLVAYVDADSLPASGEAEIEALLVAGGAEADDGGPQALGVLAGPLQHALASLRGHVEVVGTGAVALTVRAGLSARSEPDVHPDVIADLIGDPDGIRSALARLADLWTLLLAGDPGTRELDLDLYPDIHLRGLRLVGLGQPGGDRWMPVPVGCGPPAEARAGEPVPVGAPWYRVVHG